MPSTSPVVLILGAGPNIGKALARTFAAGGYKVALAARSLKETDSTDTQLNITSDFSKTADIVNAFAKVKRAFDISSVVIYNCSANTFTPADDPLAIPFADFRAERTINIDSAFVAAQQAVLGFEKLPSSAARTFIYTGNVTNVAILPKMLSSGVGKSGAAHMIWAASAGYKDRGYKYLAAVSPLELDCALKANDVEGFTMPTNERKIDLPSIVSTATLMRNSTGNWPTPTRKIRGCRHS